MNRLILTVLTTLAISFSAIVSASETSTVVVYRDVSKIGVSFAVFANSEKMGRLREGKSISMEVPAGTFVISSNVRGGEPLTVDAKAGETIYIDSELIKKRSGKYATVFTQTTEKVALESRSSIGISI